MTDVEGTNTTEDASAAAESWLIDWLRTDAGMREPRPGWAHSGLAGLLLEHGRLFTPAPLPVGTPPGEPGRCYIESVSHAWASSGELVYVEGWAWDLAWPMEHAWCAAPDGSALDLTWHRPGRAYLGLPVRADRAATIMGAQTGPLLHGPGGLASDAAMSWLRDGIPPGLLADAGRPIPL